MKQRKPKFAHSRFKKRMQRRDMNRKHRLFPLELRVIARTKKGRIYKGTVGKHDNDYGNACMVRFKVVIGWRNSHCVSLKHLKVFGRRPANPIPWYLRSEIHRLMS